MTHTKLIPSTLAKGSSKVNKNNSFVCDQVLALKKTIFPIVRGNGNKYFNFAKLYNPEGTGYSQQLAKTEQTVLEKSKEAIEILWAGKFDEKRHKKFNNEIDEILTAAYTGLKK
jgi:hypothetical protein